MRRGSARAAAAVTACAAAMAASAFDVIMGKVTEPEPEYWAVIYERVLRWPVDPEDPLIGTPYFGQAVRPVSKLYDSVQVLAESRWHEEDLQSKRGDGSDACFLEALRIYGPGAFDNRVVDFRRGVCQFVQTWADRRECAEISANGGQLRTMEPKPGVRQCWNVMLGGKGPASWKAILVRRKKPWKRFLEEMQMYCAAFGSSRVPFDYVAPSGYGLGHALNHCRSRHTFLAGHPDESSRRASLEALPLWCWDVRSDSEANSDCRRRAAKRGGETKAKKSPAEKLAVVEKFQKTISKKTDTERAEINKKRLKTLERRGIVMNKVSKDREDRLLREELMFARTVAIPFEQSKKKRAVLRAASTIRNARKSCTVLYMITKNGKNIGRVDVQGTMRPRDIVGPRFDSPR